MIFENFSKEDIQNMMKEIETGSPFEKAINRVSAENGSDTPDFILAEYLTSCLDAFDKAVKARGDWYGVKL